MGAIARLTITLPADMAGLVKGAVNEGGYASTSEVIREALRDWKLKRDLQLRQLTALRVDIDRGLADVADGRLTIASAFLSAGGNNSQTVQTPSYRNRGSRLSGDLELSRRRSIRISRNPISVAP